MLIVYSRQQSSYPQGLILLPEANAAESQNFDPEVCWSILTWKKLAVSPLR